MNTTIQRKRASFRLREDLLEKLKNAAKSTNSSLNSYVEAILISGMSNADSTALPRKQYLQQIEDAISDVHSGNCFAMQPNESLDDFLVRMEADGNV
jgi:predicted DNA-binding protein